MSKKAKDNTTIAVNRRARHEYHIEDSFEAGLVLEGWEVKSIRAGRAQIDQSYVIIKHGAPWLLGSQMTPLLAASTHVNPDPTRTRKLLLHEREISKLIGSVERKGYTLVPLKLYWARNRVKLEVGLAKGKKLHDKRASEKERDWQRDKQRMLKNS